MHDKSCTSRDDPDSKWQPFQADTLLTNIIITSKLYCNCKNFMGIKYFFYAEGQSHGIQQSVRECVCMSGDES